MKPARESASSRPKSCASLEKKHEFCPFAAPACWPSYYKNKTDRGQRSAFPSETSRFAPYILVSQRGFSSPPPRRPAPLLFPERIWCSLTGSSSPYRFPRRYSAVLYASFGAMTVGTSGLAYNRPPIETDILYQVQYVFYESRRIKLIVCVCVVCVVMDVRLVDAPAGATQTGGRSHRISPPPFVCLRGACLHFSREKDSFNSRPFPWSTVKSNFSVPTK